MPYLLNTSQDQREMLEAIGAESVSELFDAIPENCRLNRPLDIPQGMTEFQLTRHVSDLAAKNLNAGNSICFLGGGSYDHFIPAVVDELASRGEFYTSYTPYQPEVSQGNLQAMFEYQTLICQLTGMDVSNASLYDGGSSTVEAVLMSQAATRRDKRVVLCGTLHPEYRQVVETYLMNQDCEIVTVAAKDGVVTAADIEAEVNEQTSCVVIQHPNFFGNFEDLTSVIEVAHKAGALVVQVFDPISLGLVKRPGDYGVDIAVAEGQALGNPMLYGGPYLGIIACRESFMRRMPGRIAGQTVSKGDRRCWVLTLQTREQHIRREKATSNICTNQGLFALRTSIYLSLLGPEGMREVSERCIRGAHYAAEQIKLAEGVELAFDQPFFKEFVVRIKDGQVDERLSEAMANHVLAGIPLGQWYPELNDCLLVAVTEKRTKADIDTWAQLLSGSFAAAT